MQIQQTRVFDKLQTLFLNQMSYIVNCESIRGSENILDVEAVYTGLQGYCPNIKEIGNRYIYFNDCLKQGMTLYTLSIYKKLNDHRAVF